MSDISDSENEVDIVEETLNVGCVTNKEFLKLTTSTCNYEDKENLGYENFDNTNVAASSLILFYYSGKECRPQEPLKMSHRRSVSSLPSDNFNHTCSGRRTAAATQSGERCVYRTFGSDADSATPALSAAPET
ncbi:hypothetical protein GEV33_005970 [Tenebrio molitor]|uniref:Uncharacterized protein n=1 Tax=Tenebrio molitor TaxID=7067 RepID=A0A8J6HMQ5_TENMO|nr:hypothetical protein GEV33_005970 [Tenebrio molitor]